MNKKLLITGAILGVLGIVLGAFAAHGLRELVSETAIQSFETGVRYQIYHAFLLLILGSTNILKESSKKVVYLLVLVGVLFFSGSIYGLATDDLTAFNFKQIALVTPLGGVLLIGAWTCLLINFLKVQKDN
ncbi:DUF423 domain-containing protein [Oceanihabitans sediminis]|uniref:DUF423 domain-containing protein n=1 Tax=Oceanihabitans sediminis TaxID=1812012 RepID=A0A368P7R6_9FLAO|nr:DUF423 domain-containing protein [Oceanihabitans sediminis]MDX1278734.1 DUF423 domain-containing protein [Oceanihabitans sediminis]MDX1773258.1 DUF423 domain-containing protein [Oceanihabitans sediminis]RBP34951.1 uncharacterized membrane protein YgdD (TMEM256/DUF423 family) [Oceanihabitans sediminis]RCU58588.1 DUF423 domain-containing protein [Oceanihabitans sediminis]